MKKFNKIGVLTSGGDAPGMNPAIRAVVCAARAKGVEVVAIYEGYKGLIHKHLETVSGATASGLIAQGGTAYYSDRCLEFKTEEGIAAAKKTCEEEHIDGIVAIGGDGTFRGATDFTNHGVPCIGLPGTIDNDITATDYSIGYDTALNTIVRVADQLRDTCMSHRRCNVIEVMGRYAGYLALDSGIASGASGIALKEVPFDEEAMYTRMKRALAAGQRAFTVMVAEGIPLSEGGDPQYSEKLAKRIAENTGIETKFLRLAHVVRGGSPTGRDRLLACEMGVKAVDLLLEGQSNLVVCTQKDQIVSMDIHYALSLDRLYKGKCKEGELEAHYTAAQIAEMHEFCRTKAEAFRSRYEIANRLADLGQAE